MISLKFIREFKSIKSLQPLTIPDFSIITGLNGSGKTHLLQALEGGHVEIDGISSSAVAYYNLNEFKILYGGDNDITAFRDRNELKRSQNTSQIDTDRQSVLQNFPWQLGVFDKMYQAGIRQNHLKWSEDDIIKYKAIMQDLPTQTPDVIASKLPDSLKNIILVTGPIPVSDLEQVKSLWQTNLAKRFILNYGYDYSRINWPETDLIKYKEMEEKGIMVDPVGSNGILSANFINFYFAIKNFIGAHPDEEINIEIFSKAVRDVFKDIETHIRMYMSPPSLSMLERLTRGGSILEPISVDNGVLDLNQLANEEKKYQIDKLSNKFAEFLQGNGNDNSSDNQVSDLYESPVELLNRTLEEYDCNGYEFQASKIPAVVGVDFNTHNIQINLFNKIDQYQTDLSALSSGERTLLALTFYIYKLRNKKGNVTRVLLLDEIDAPLHPSMSRRLVNVLYSLFHKEMGFNIILSTHSPSTVAFAPSDSLLLMKKGGPERLTVCSKDAALKELTIGVPSFSINYENRRQVFTESKYDVEYYESLYDIFSSHLNPDISLNFIASGDVQKDSNGQPKSNCEQVIKITQLLRVSGNKFIWGIIDWDLKTEKPTSNYVSVLGWQERYSIENYILDPLLMGTLLLMENLIAPEDFGMVEDFKFYDIINKDASDLQKIVNAILRKLGLDETTEVDYNTYKTVGGIELKISKKFSDCQGHSLEALYLKTFPKLNGIKGGKENLLKMAVISKVIANFELIAPIALLEVLQSVQEI